MSNASSKAPVAAGSAVAAPQPAKRQAPAWGVFAAVVVILICFVALPTAAQIVVSAIPSVLGWGSVRADQWVQHSDLANFLYVALAEALTSGFLFWFIRRRHGSFRRVVALRKPRWSDAGYAFLGALSYILLFIVVVQVVSAILPLDTTKEQAIGFDKHSTGLGLLLPFISLAILPPIVEEMVFRGFFYGTLRARNIRMGTSILVTSLVFGSLHLFGSGDGSLLWIAFVDTFVLSLILCYVREKTGSIVATIMIHALKNGFVFLNLFILGAR